MMSTGVSFIYSITSFSRWENKIFLKFHFIVVVVGGSGLAPLQHDEERYW